MSALADAMLLAVGPHRLREVWSAEIVELIEDANEKLPSDMLGDPFVPAQVYADCATGMRQLWLAQDLGGALLGLGLTGVHVDPMTERRSLRLLLTAGHDWRHWAWTLAAIEAWGREQGCSVSRIEGRKGWARRLPAAYRLTGERCGAAGLVWERSLLDG